MSKWNPGSCQTMASSSKRRGRTESQGGDTNCSVGPDNCGVHGQGLSDSGCAPPAFLRSTTAPDGSRVDPTVILKEVRPPNPQWYDKLFAWALKHVMEFHRKKTSGYREKLFNGLAGESKKVLELGIGTGPNIQYYANVPDITVYGVDPNKQMEKYAKAAALRAGLPPSNFYFTQAVGEGLPAEDCSMDVVVGTLVLCSVKDVQTTLQEVLRVLKPGGRFIFLEHVAAPDGTPLRLLQGILNPLWKFVADGCHLNRGTGKEIYKAGFSNVDLNMSFMPGIVFVSPHVYGVAIK